MSTDDGRALKSRIAELDAAFQQVSEIAVNLHRSLAVIGNSNAFIRTRMGAADKLMLQHLEIISKQIEISGTLPKKIVDIWKGLGSPGKK